MANEKMFSGFPQKFAEWIDAEAQPALSGVRDFTDYLRAKPNLDIHPDQHIAMTVDDSVLRGEPLLTEVDHLGRPVSYFFHHGDRVLGLKGDPFDKAMNVANKIWRHKTVHRIATLEEIEKWVLGWISDVVRQKQHSALPLVLEAILASTVERVTIIVPIERLFIDEAFEFGRAKIRMLSNADIESHLKSLPELTDQQLEVWKAGMKRDWAGHAMMEFTFEATPNKAAELSLQHADEYCALLQFYFPLAALGSSPSLTAPRGRQPYRSEVWMRIGPGKIGYGNGMLDFPSRLEISGDNRKRIEEKLGLWTLSSLAFEPACDYEERALQALLMYGRACYRADLADKLVQIVTAIEMLVLRDPKEPLVAVGADRFAFAIGSRPDMRQQIAINFREAYGLRSRRSHHGHVPEYNPVVMEFLRNAWTFFLMIIRGVGRFRTKAQFIDGLERRKYGFND